MTPPKKEKGKGCKCIFQVRSKLKIGDDSCSEFIVGSAQLEPQLQLRPTGRMRKCIKDLAFPHRQYMAEALGQVKNTPSGCDQLVTGFLLQSMLSDKQAFLTSFSRSLSQLCKSCICPNLGCARILLAIAHITLRKCFTGPHEMGII